MKKLSVLFVALLLTVSFAANAQNTYKDKVSKRTIPLALGSGVTVAAGNTVNVTTIGQGDLTGLCILTKVGTALSTVNVIAGGEVGDIITMQTYRASEDVFVSKNANIYLGAAGGRTLSDPADKLFLMKRSAMVWDEVGFYDNN